MRDTIWIKHKLLQGNSNRGTSGLGSAEALETTQTRTQPLPGMSQRVLRLSPSLDLNTHSHINKVDLHMGLGVQWAVCIDTLGGLWRRPGKGNNQQGWWLRGPLTTDGANGYCWWELQVGCSRLDTPGLETEKEVLSNNSLASISKWKPAFGASCGHWELSISL